jgi:hypothetical protein
MLKRRLFRQAASLQDRLLAFAREVREKASRLQPGPEKDALLRKARRADTAAQIDGWANSRELRPPN